MNYNLAFRSENLERIEIPSKFDRTALAATILWESRVVVGDHRKSQS